MKLLSRFLVFAVLLVTGLARAQEQEDKVIELKSSKLVSESQTSTAIAFSPSGRMASASTTGVVQFWNATSRSLDNTLEGEKDQIIKIAFSPDGAWLAQACKSGELRLVDVRKGIVKKKLSNHKGIMTSVSFSADGNYIASGGVDGKVTVWELKTGAILHTFEESKKEVSCVQFSHSDAHLAVGSYDGKVRLYDIFEGSLDQQFNPNSGRVRSVSFSPDDKFIATGTDDKTVKIWDVDLGALKKTLEGHEKVVHDLSYSPDGKYIASCDLDFKLMIREVATGDVIFEDDDFFKLMGISFSYDGKYLAAVDYSKNIKLYDLAPLEISQRNTLNKALYSAYHAGLERNAPVIHLIEPDVPELDTIFHDGETNMFTVRGKVSSDVGLLILLVNGIETAVNEEGYFENTFMIRYGLQTISVKAIDLDKQSTTYDFYLNRPFRKEHRTLASESVRRGKDFALCIGTDEYTEWNGLTNPINDMNTVADELESHYGFDVRRVQNPTLDEMYSVLREYSKMEFSPDDQLFIFIAGHGEYDKVFNEGYIVAKDSRLNDEVKRSYISHSNLRTIVNNIKCDHIFVVMDVCFGGTFDRAVTGTRGNAYSDDADKEEFIVRKMKYKTRKYLTSGGKEYVPDGRPGHHSPFCRRLLEGLRSNGGEDRILTLRELIPFVEKTTPEPRFGEFGDNEPGSDFLFIYQ